MMGAIVSKFGGSSMADAVMFQKVSKIVSEKRKPNYIILSAPGKRYKGDAKITDLLCLAHSLCADGKSPDAPIHHITQRFDDIIAALNLTKSLRHLTSNIEDSVAVSRDYAASRGEYLCARIFAEYTGIPFVDAASLIHFDENGRIMPEKIRQSVRNMASRLDCAIIPGFYGSMPDGSIKTFSRGGSDITGALIAAALNADLYENWTDVDGLMSVDPSVCSDAIHYPAVSYRQMRMLAKAGAHVLHPYCLEPVREAGVPTELRNTFAPHRPGTYISEHVRKKVSCICAEDDMSFIEINTLHSETLSILEGIQKDLFTGTDGRQILALKSAAIGTSAAIISAFGLPSKDYSTAVSAVHPIGYAYDEECLRLMIEPERKNAVMCELHSMLIHK